MLGVAGGMDKTVVKPIEDFFIEHKAIKTNIHGGWSYYSKDSVENKRIEKEVMFVKNIIGLVFHVGIPLVLIFLFDLFINVPRRRLLKKMGEEGFLKHYAIANGLPQDLFEVRTK